MNDGSTNDALTNDVPPKPEPLETEDAEIPRSRGWWLVCLFCVMEGLTSLTLSAAIVHIARMHDQHFDADVAHFSDLTQRLSDWRWLVPIPSLALTGLAIAAMTMPKRRRRYGAWGLAMILVVQIWLGLQFIFLYLPLAGDLSKVTTSP